jgi:predicted TIM-barrel fold metal-dependent hydrolase
MARLEFAAFDADNHYYEATDAFTRHIEPQFARRCMQWAQLGGKQRLLVAGAVNSFIPNPTFDPVARPGCLDDYYRGRNPGALGMKELFGALEPINPAYRERDERLKVMDTQGLERAWFFPTLGVGMEEALKADPDACHAAFRAFNRWLEEDWGFAYRERIYALPYITLLDVKQAVAELEYLLARGTRGVVMRAAPVACADRSRSPADPHFDPFWARVNEAGIVVTGHGGDSGYGVYAEAWGEGGKTEAFRTSPFKLLMGARPAYDWFAALIAHRLFARFPNLRIASIEMGAFWVPQLLQALRRAYGQEPGQFAENPVDTFLRHVWVAPFHEDDVPGLKDLIGADRMLLGSDWPHAEGLPEPTDYVHELVGFSAREVRQVMRDNALALTEPRPARAA